MPESPMLFIVIPAFNEISLLSVLKSLKNASLERIPIEVIVVFNASKNSSDQIKYKNQNAFDELNIWKSDNSSSFFKVNPEIHNNLDPKKAGVGLARKIGMDKASSEISNNGNDGIIVCLDADCVVDENYIEEIFRFFNTNSKFQGCSIYFEHRFEQGNESLKEATIQYEIHLRYFKMALSFAEFPLSFHTVGSCMAVTNEAYIKSRGMNTKKAGEDFYFLQKIFSQYSFGELNTTTVYPLGRLSDRVPFGTGAALNKWKNINSDIIPTYQFKAFLELKFFLKKISDLDSFQAWRNFFQNEVKSLIINEFLIVERFHIDFENILNNTRNIDQLLPNFFRWFNNFRKLKCLNYLRDTNYPQKGILDEAGKLLTSLGYKSPKSSLDMLILFRNLDKNRDYK